MGIPVITKVSGGMPVIDVTATKPALGVAVTEAANGYGTAVTKVSVGGLPVTFETIGVEPGVTYATLNGTPTNVTLTNGNLTATHSSAASNSGARSTTALNTGKRYFEVTVGVAHGTNDGIGLVPAAISYTSMISGVGGPIAFYGASGLLYFNTVNTGKTIGTWQPGDIICAAIDFTTAYTWFRRNGGNWNGDPAANPATGTGGLGPGTVGGTPTAPTITFGGTGTLAGDNLTANFGASAFTYAVPAGFTAGWPV